VNERIWVMNAVFMNGLSAGLAKYGMFHILPYLRKYGSISRLKYGKYGMAQ
jgi:hypothetical protein